MKLISPPKDTKDTLDLDKATPREVALFLARKHGWVVTERDGKLYTGEADRETPAAVPKVLEFPRLKVPYFSQRDSQVPNQWWRSCFSSAVAMAVKFLKPGALTDSPNADDEYLQRVLQYGDTTDPNAQIRALAHLGLKAQRATALNFTDLDRQLGKGKPIPIGILIHGHVSQPSGGGHWITVIGRTANGYLVHDPYGELDLTNGGYLHSDGKAKNYSRTNLGKRWMVEGDRAGWGIIFD